VLILLQQHRAHQACDRRVVGEDADHAGAAFGFLTVVKPPSGIDLRGRPPGGEHRRCALWGRCNAAHLGPGYGSKIETLAARSF
jgi:hypothetical protein